MPAGCGHAYLIRHGQSDWNLLEMTQGQSMTPRLTALGREQAEFAGLLIRRDLGKRAVSEVRTSDLTRALETARIVADVSGGEVVPDERLREQHLGSLEGRSYAHTWAAAAEHDWTDLDLPIAGGESPRQVRDRMAAVLDEIDRTGVTVLVSHGDAIRAALAHIAGVPSNEAPWAEVPNGAVARIIGTDVTWLTR